jgi:hypothetical protein
MTRMHLDVVMQHQQPAEERFVQLIGEAPGEIVAKEVRAADRAYEERVAGKNARRCLGRAHDEAHVLGSVTRCVHDLDMKVAQVESLAIGCLVMRVMQMRARPGDDRGAQCGELARTGNEVRMDVRLERELDSEPVLAGSGDVDIDVATRIDEGGAPRPRTGDEVRALRQPFIEEALKHEVESSRLPTLRCTQGRPEQRGTTRGGS